MKFHQKKFVQYLSIFQFFLIADYSQFHNIDYNILIETVIQLTIAMSLSIVENESVFFFQMNCENICARLHMMWYVVIWCSENLHSYRLFGLMPRNLLAKLIICIRIIKKPFKYCSTNIVSFYSTDLYAFNLPVSRTFWLYTFLLFGNTLVWIFV